MGKRVLTDNGWADDGAERLVVTWWPELPSSVTDSDNFDMIDDRIEKQRAFPVAKRAEAEAFARKIGVGGFHEGATIELQRVEIDCYDAGTALGGWTTIGEVEEINAQAVQP